MFLRFTMDLGDVLFQKEEDDSQARVSMGKWLCLKRPAD